MSFRQRKVSAPIRLVAAATMLVWVGAITLCQIQCCSGDERRSASDHADAAACCHHNQERSNAPGDQEGCTFCLSLKSLLHNACGLSISKPPLQPLYELAFAPAPVRDTATSLIAEHFRQAKPRDWVFTPEVCLGPAFHSLAPPVFSPV